MDRKTFKKEKCLLNIKENYVKIINEELIIDQKD